MLDDRVDGIFSVPGPARRPFSPWPSRDCWLERRRGDSGAPSGLAPPRDVNGLLAGALAKALEQGLKGLRGGVPDHSGILNQTAMALVQQLPLPDHQGVPVLR